jgi:hypothetical protein
MYVLSYMYLLANTNSCILHRLQTITNDKFQVLMLICITFFFQITVPFQYEWLDQLFKELATVAFL